MQQDLKVVDSKIGRNFLKYCQIAQGSSINIFGETKKLHPPILSNSLKPLNHYSYIVRTGLITYYIRKAGLPKGRIMCT
jgi:hypothetical protein